MEVITYNGRQVIAAKHLLESGALSAYAYDKQRQRGKIDVAQRGCRNTPAMVYYDTLPIAVKVRFDACLCGDLKSVGTASANTATQAPALYTSPVYEGFFKSLIRADREARDFFASYEVTPGVPLRASVIAEYYTNAMVLNAMRDALNERKIARNACGVRGNKKTDLFSSVVREVAALDKKEFPHSLPTSEKRLRATYKEYFGGLNSEGEGTKNYACLIHKNYNNQNKRKVTEAVKLLVLSLYVRTNKPYVTWTQEDFNDFVNGITTVVDYSTGEIFNPADFLDGKGKPITISEGTARNIILDPANKIIIEAMRMGYHKFGALSRPHYHRERPQFSLSKISMDDRDLPRLTHDGRRVKAYYAYDVMSGAIVGWAHSMEKDSNLFIDSMRSMFRNLEQNGLGVPMELEVENHLVRNFKDGLMQAGKVFPLVRWCAPTNSQEKHAEHFNREKKYGYEKLYQDGIGRVRGNRLEANQTDNMERYYDEQANEYRYHDKRYTFEELVADDIQTIEAYNRGIRNGSTVSRWQTLLQNVNPRVEPIDRALWMRYIGYEVKTSVRRNQYVQACNAYYQLSTPEVLSRLQPNNYNVTAYYLPNIDGTVGEVYLYQGERQLCCAKKIEKFTTARAEWTAADGERMTEQAKYVSKFDKMVKDGAGALAKVKTISEDLEQYESVPVEVVADIAEMEPLADEHGELVPVLIEEDSEYWQKRAFENA